MGLIRSTPLASPAVKIYPNPGRDVLHIRGITQTRIRLINAMGQVQNSRLLSSPGLLRLEVSSLPAGVYYLQMEYAGLSERYTWIKSN